MAKRLLSLPELALLLYMLREKPDSERFLFQLPTIEVEDMNDGGMGSLRFASSKPNRKRGSVTAALQFNDDDGVPVLVALYLDKEGELYELDSWKVNYSPLIRIPNF
ncbi:DUF6984 family protein [Hymenobacter sp. B1770]|uniref:DUF6984 family protein n=1 Tax=Hymenobacter sp. B1770 TaxID=1718788 RepID=UPI003CE77340